MGEVYRAHDQHGTLVNESARKHFHKEALILSQLNQSSKVMLESA